MEKERILTREKLIYILIFLASISLRIGLLGRVPLLESEAAWAIQAWELFKGGSAQVGHQVGYLSLTRLFFALLGASDLSARLWPALVGSLIIWVPFLYKDRLGSAGSILIAFGLAFDPSLVAVSRIAGGPMTALAFLLLMAGFFHQKQFGWSITMLGLGLLSGPDFWLGVILLVISCLLFSWLGVFSMRDYWAERIIIIQDRAGNLGQTLELFGAPVGIFLLVASFILTRPEGLTAWAGALPVFFKDIFQNTGVRSVRILVDLAVSNPFILVFGLLGFIQAWRSGRNPGIFSSIWFLFGLVVLLLVPGREAVDLAWLAVPLWIGAGSELLRGYKLAGNSWEVYGLAALIYVLVVLNWLTLIGMVYQIGNERAVLLQVGLFLASFALVFISLMLVVGGWSSYRLISTPREDWYPAIKGLYLGLALVLFTFNLSSLSQGAYLKQGDPRSIWSDGSGAGQFRLLEDSIYDVSISQTGRGKVIQGTALVDRDALRWTLREYQGIKFQTTYDQDNLPPIIITSDLDQYRVDPQIYRGQDFAAETVQGWEGLLPSDWISWTAFRSGPVVNQVIILWVRNDIYSGY